MDTKASLVQRGSVAQWITRLTTDQKIAGSNPARVVFLFFFQLSLVMYVSGTALYIYVLAEVMLSAYHMRSNYSRSKLSRMKDFHNFAVLFSRMPGSPIL